MTVFLIFSILYSFRIKNLLNPLFLFITPLYISYILAIFFYTDTFGLKAGTQVLLLYSIFSFLIGYFLYSFFSINSIKHQIYKYDSKIQYNSLILKAYEVLGIIGFLIGCYEMLRNGINGPSNLFFQNVRLQSDSLSFVGTYSSIFLMVSVSVEIYNLVCNRGNVSYKKKLHIAMLVIALLLTNLFTVAKTGVLQFFLMMLYLIFFNKHSTKRYSDRLIEKVKKNIKIIICIGILVSIFVFFSIATNKMGSITDIKNNFFMKYLGYPLIVFDENVLGNPSISFGSYTFGPIVKLFNVIGIAPEFSKNIVLGLQHKFNVFGFMGGPYLDFGSIGLFITMFIIGFFCAFIYKKNIYKGGYWTLFYAIYTYSIVISFYSYQFSNTSYVYIVFLFLILRINTKEKTEVQNEIR